jgi:hypothetical protein
MLSTRACVVCTLAVVTALTFRSDGQSVISTHSGIVHFFEGTVYLGDQPLQSHPGKFSSIPKGAELRTAEGRAEVLLTPGVFVRIGERTTIRIVDNELSHTRVELLAGSAVVDSEEPGSGTSVTLIFRNWSVRSHEQGVYRIDSDPPRLWVLQGNAEISADAHDGSLLIEQSMDVPLAPVLVPQRTMDQPHDALSTWAEGRQQSISADNTIAANIQDPATMDPSISGSDSFTYFPMLGLPPLGSSSSSAFNSLGTYQPGFNSLYLPGYAFLPLLIGLRSGGGFPPTRLPSHPHPIPVLPIYPHPIPVHPVSPHPMVVHPAPQVGIHVGIRR